MYFNRAIAGGLPVAGKLYDHDYWATALREAAEWVAHNYKPTPGTVVLYASGAEPQQVDLFLPQKADSGAEFRRAAPDESATLHLPIRRYHQNHELKAGKRLFSIVREGVPLVDIVEIESPARR